MKPKILFVVMSAVSKPSTVDQLARSLAPHQVLVHHDFSQRPDFALTAPNVIFVPNPKRTGWAHFGFVDGIFHSMLYALEKLDFDYLQLLSPSCLPIKPMEDFQLHVSGPADAHFDCVDLLGDRDALMSVGYRALTPEKSLRFRAARRLSDSYFGQLAGRRDEAGIWLRSGHTKSLLSRLALLTIKTLSRPEIGRHIFDDQFRPYYGSVWFGARRHVVAGMVQGFRTPGVRQYFSQLCIAEEFLIPTLLMYLRPKKGSMNHHIKSFTHAHPGVFDESDLPQLGSSCAFFARKFPDDCRAPVRLRVINELVETDPFFSESKTIRKQPSVESARMGTPLFVNAMS
ncbi:MAG: hypothetical protein JWP47_2551 [Polaromonas sp.]|nr:hypothetical protein [Polaromonas sp.]